MADPSDREPRDEPDRDGPAHNHAHGEGARQDAGVRQLCRPEVMLTFARRLFRNAVHGLMEAAWATPMPGTKERQKLNRAQLFELGDEEGMVAFICQRCDQGAVNGYLAPGLRTDGAIRTRRNGDEFVRSLVAARLDCDLEGCAERAVALFAKYGLQPSIVGDTGRCPYRRSQIYFVFNQPAGPEDFEQVQRIERNLAALVGGDDSVIKLNQPMRFLGTPACPVKPGRVLEMTELVEVNDRDWDLDELDELVRRMLEAEGPWSPSDGGGSGPGAAPEFEIDLNTATPKLDIADLIELARQPRKWRDSALRATAKAVALGMTEAEILDWLTPLLQQPGYTYAQTREELRVMVEGALKKGWHRRKPAGDAPASAPEEVSPDAKRERPCVFIAGGQLHAVVDDVERHLIDADVGLYQRGGQVVRVVIAPVKVSTGEQPLLQIIPVTIPALIDSATRHIHFLRCRRNEWVDTDCPDRIAKIYLERVGRWSLPILTGLISAPTLRADGSVLEHEGYDAETGLLFDARGTTFPPVPVSPTREDALNALAVLKQLLSTFPFADRASRSVALSAFLTCLIRRSLPTAPLHAFTAPTAGSGKSLLVDMTSMIATGVRAPVISQGKKEEELEKRLGAALIGGFEFVSIDNCEAPLQSEVLCQTLTQQVVRVRVLGLSKIVDAPTNAMMFATGNNLAVVGDLTRRVIQGRLDPPEERPELREFPEDPLTTIAADRGRYVIAALTILRAYEVACKPNPPTQLGSFEDWSSRVRGALIWLGEKDPCATMDEIREEDPKLEQLRAVIIPWRRIFGERLVTVRDLINCLDPNLKDALLAVAGEGDAVDAQKLGQWLRSNKRRRVEGVRIFRDDTRSGVALWRLVVPEGASGIQGSD